MWIHHYPGQQPQVFTFWSRHLSPQKSLPSQRRLIRVQTLKVICFCCWWIRGRCAGLLSSEIRAETCWFADIFKYLTRIQHQFIIVSSGAYFFPWTVRHKPAVFPRFVALVLCFLWTSSLHQISRFVAYMKLVQHQRYQCFNNKLLSLVKARTLQYFTHKIPYILLNANMYLAFLTVIFLKAFRTLHFTHSYYNCKIFLISWALLWGCVIFRSQFNC